MFKYLRLLVLISILCVNKAVGCELVYVRLDCNFLCFSFILRVMPIPSIGCWGEDVATQSFKLRPCVGGTWVASVSESERVASDVRNLMTSSPTLPETFEIESSEFHKLTINFPRPPWITKAYTIYWIVCELWVSGILFIYLFIAGEIQGLEYV